MSLSRERSSQEDFYKKLQEVARFTNISDKYFECTFAWGAAPPVLHRFDPGESRVLPWPIANHLATHLARAILRGKASVAERKNDKALATEERINKMRHEIISDHTTAETPRPKSANEIVAEQIERLNPEDRAVVAPEGEQVLTKADIIARLEEYGVKFNARRSKAELQEQLEAAMAGNVTE